MHLLADHVAPAPPSVVDGRGIGVRHPVVDLGALVERRHLGSTPEPRLRTPLGKLAEFEFESSQRQR
eukprot:1475680-Alexandrium_andersonii.AAC.1